MPSDCRKTDLKFKFFRESMPPDPPQHSVPTARFTKIPPPTSPINIFLRLCHILRNLKSIISHNMTFLTGRGEKKLRSLSVPVYFQPHIQFWYSQTPSISTLIHSTLQSSPYCLLVQFTSVQSLHVPSSRGLVTEAWSLPISRERVQKSPVNRVRCPRANPQIKYGSKYGPTCHQRYHADVTNVFTLVRSSPHQ